MMTEVRGASNAKAKRELGWQPRYPSWREGFARGARLSRRRFEELRPRAFAHRLPHARQRERGGGRGPGGPPPPPPRRGRRASGSSRRAPTCRRWSRGCRSTSCARRARGARATSASGCPSRSSRAPTSDPARQAELADSLSLAFLVLLESLSPEQRAVFLLREVFDYDYARIAEIVGKSEPNVRQLAVRARRHVEQGRPRFEHSREQRERLADRFLAAAQEGDLAAPRGAARRGRRAARRRRRQGARARPARVRARAGGAHAGGVGARRARASAASTRAPRGRQRPAGRDDAGPARAG